MESKQPKYYSWEPFCGLHRLARDEKSVAWHPAAILQGLTPNAVLCVCTPQVLTEVRGFLFIYFFCFRAVIPSSSRWGQLFRSLGPMTLLQVNFGMFQFAKLLLNYPGHEEKPSFFSFLSVCFCFPCCSDLEIFSVPENWESSLMNHSSSAELGSTSALHWTLPFCTLCLPALCLRLLPQRSFTNTPPCLQGGFFFTFFFSLQEMEMGSGSWNKGHHYSY